MRRLVRSSLFAYGRTLKQFSRSRTEGSKLSERAEHQGVGKKREKSKFDNIWQKLTDLARKTDREPRCVISLLPHPPHTTAAYCCCAIGHAGSKHNTLGSGALRAPNSTLNLQTRHAQLGHASRANFQTKSENTTRSVLARFARFAHKTTR